LFGFSTIAANQQLLALLLLEEMIGDIIIVVLSVYFIFVCKWIAFMWFWNFGTFKIHV